MTEFKKRKRFVPGFYMETDGTVWLMYPNGDYEFLDWRGNWERTYRNPTYPKQNGYLSAVKTVRLGL